jgi:hypothetical protein
MDTRKMNTLPPESIEFGGLASLFTLEI